MQPSSEEFQETGRQLERIARATGLLGEVYQPREPDFLAHNETQRSEILQAWTQVAARTGHHDLAISREARITHDPLGASPNGLEGSEHRDEVRRNLLALRDAASLINDPQVDPRRLITHNRSRRDIIPPPAWSGSPTGTATTSWPSDTTTSSSPPSPSAGSPGTPSGPWASTPSMPSWPTPSPTTRYPGRGTHSGATSPSPRQRRALGDLPVLRSPLQPRPPAPLVPPEHRPPPPG